MVIVILFGELQTLPKTTTKFPIFPRMGGRAFFKLSTQILIYIDHKIAKLLPERFAIMFDQV